MTILEKLHKIEEEKCVYNIHYCKAGVGFVFYYPEKVKDPEKTNWETGLTVGKYYSTFETAVEEEFIKLSKQL